MRTFVIPPKYLDKKILLYEHWSIHVILNAIVYGGRFKSNSWVNMWRRNTKGLIQRHRLICKEFEFRGVNHQSPISLQRKFFTGEGLEISSEDIRKDLIYLLSRKGLKIDTFSLVELSKKLRFQEKKT